MTWTKLDSMDWPRLILRRDCCCYNYAATCSCCCCSVTAFTQEIAAVNVAVVVIVIICAKYRQCSVCSCCCCCCSCCCCCCYSIHTRGHPRGCCSLRRCSCQLFSLMAFVQSIAKVHCAVVVAAVAVAVAVRAFIQEVGLFLLVDVSANCFQSSVCSRVTVFCCYRGCCRWYFTRSRRGCCCSCHCYY